ncbi:Uma2 family endonuclease [Lusitaniella coriacea]|uniref:Uma2 family endonuclease n=1 Tax=Lusitaniella coriacea TaxID=1983105 RepID=UPI003CFAC211
MLTLAQWSVKDYHRMTEAGILRDRRVELLTGQIVEMSPETPLHYNTTKRGVRYLEELLRDLAEVRFNGPITLATSEPEPDIAIVRLPESQYNDRHPNARDIFWLIEVANTSQKKDLEVKKAIYATAQIPEYWVLDVQKRTITVFQNPQDNDYTDEWEANRGEIISLAFPDVRVSVERLLQG